MAEFFLYSITLIMTTWAFFHLTFTHTDHMNTRANVILTSGAIIAAPVAWYCFVFPILLFAFS